MSNEPRRLLHRPCVTQKPNRPLVLTDHWTTSFRLIAACSQIGIFERAGQAFRRKLLCENLQHQTIGKLQDQTDANAAWTSTPTPMVAETSTVIQTM